MSIKNSSTPHDLANLVFKKLKGAKINYPQPCEDVLNVLFETLFYTSLKTEEGQFIKVTITLIDPEKPDPSPPMRIVADRWSYMYFSEKIPYTVKNLMKLSKAADPWSSSLAVYYDSNNELYIWGMIDQAVHYQSFLNYEVEEGPEQPGLFQTTISGIGNIVVIFDYELIATLKQNTLISNYIDVFRNGLVNEILTLNSKPIISKIKAYINKNIIDESFNDWSDYCQRVINESLSRILLRIQNYQHGGALLITNNISNDLDIKYRMSYSRLKESIISLNKVIIANTNYSIKVSENYLDENKRMLPVKLYLDEIISEIDKKEIRDELKGAIRFVSSLSCIDGLIVLTTDLKIAGFGAVIKLKEIPENVYTSKTATIYEDRLSTINSNHFGTRHRSMFSYCWHNAGSLGFVVSQDGDIRAITRLNDKLIMWENIKVQQFIKSKKLKRLIVMRRTK